MDSYTSSQLAVQVHQAVIVFSGGRINLLSGELGYIFQCILASTLHDNLMSNILFAAVNQTVFPSIGYVKIVSNQVAFSFQQAVNHFRGVIYDLQFQLQTE